MNNEQSELAKRVQRRNEEREAQKTPTPQISQIEVRAAAWVWQLGVVAIDITTAYIVWQITMLFYGILWMLAGAGGLLWSERQRQRVGNNEAQRRIGEAGVIVSLTAVVVMAIASGVAYILGYARIGWIEALTLTASIGLFFYHIVQARRFHILDDEFIEISLEARREAEHKRDLREIERARREVEKERELVGMEQLRREQHGDAFDAAYSGGAKMRPAMQYNSSVHVEELADESPNASRGGKRN